MQPRTRPQAQPWYCPPPLKVATDESWLSSKAVGSGVLAYAMSLLPRQTRSPRGFASRWSAGQCARRATVMLLRENSTSRLLATLLFLTVAILHSAFAGIQEARAAYDRGDFSSAALECKKLAQSGNIEAQVMLGLLLINGKGVSKNVSEGRYWLERAANSGTGPEPAKAQHNLGVMYEGGLGVARDMHKAIDWYLRAAKNGDASAQSNLGVIYLSGDGIERDSVKGIYWLTKAAE